MIRNHKLAESILEMNSEGCLSTSQDGTTER